MFQISSSKRLEINFYMIGVLIVPVIENDISKLFYEYCLLIHAAKSLSFYYHMIYFLVFLRFREIFGYLYEFIDEIVLYYFCSVIFSTSPFIFSFLTHFRVCLYFSLLGYCIDYNGLLAFR